MNNDLNERGQHVQIISFLNQDNYWTSHISNVYKQYVRNSISIKDKVNIFLYTHFLY